MFHVEHFGRTSCPVLRFTSCSPSFELARLLPNTTSQIPIDGVGPIGTAANSAPCRSRQPFKSNGASDETMGSVFIRRAPALAEALSSCCEEVDPEGPRCADQNCFTWNNLS